MIDILALAFSAVALVIAGVLLWRDAQRWDAAQSDPTAPKRKTIASRLEAVIKKHSYSVEPGHRTSLASVKDIIAAAERESAKPRFIR